VAKQKAFGYVRVSSQEQSKHGQGIEIQEEQLRAFAKAGKMHLAEIFADRGVSGTKKMRDRPEMARMVAAIVSNGVGIVLVAKLDRVARRASVLRDTLRRLEAIGVRVIETGTGSDLSAFTDDDKPEEKLGLGMRGVIAEYERDVIAKRLKEGRLRKRREAGYCEGRIPYGGRPGEEIEEEQRVIELIKELRRKPRGKPRRGMLKIAEELNRREIKTRTGSKWYAGSVRLVLKRAAQRKA